MMDCTPDISNQEQHLLVIRIINLNLEKKNVASKIKEHFINVIYVEPTTGFNLTNVLISKLKEYGIDFYN